jgi:hypothetical protein
MKEEEEEEAILMEEFKSYDPTDQRYLFYLFNLITSSCMLFFLAFYFS